MRNFFITNLAVRTGNYDSASLGSAWKMLTKYKFRAGRFPAELPLKRIRGRNSSNPEQSVRIFSQPILPITGTAFYRGSLLVIILPVSDRVQISILNE